MQIYVCVHSHISRDRCVTTGAWWHSHSAHSTWRLWVTLLAITHRFRVYGSTVKTACSCLSEWMLHMCCVLPYVAFFFFFFLVFFFSFGLARVFCDPLRSHWDLTRFFQLERSPRGRGVVDLGSAPRAWKYDR